MNQEFVSQLEKRFPGVRCLDQKEDLIPYSFDGTATYRQMPGLVVFPENSETVSGLVKLAAEFNVPIVTRGSGTGLSGGSLPVDGCLVLCLLKMNRILEVDQDNLTLLAEAGAITLAVAEAADQCGLFYPPDPGSMKISTIGGNVAENSGGLRGLKYGVTRNYVMGLEVVLASGEILFTGNKCVKDVAGYSMRDLFIGSEGTLGIVTKILLRLIPKPAKRQTMLATYATMEAAADTVSAIIAARIIPCTLEFLDQVTINCVEDYTKVGLPRDAAAILLIECDGHASAVADEMTKILELTRLHGALAVQVAETPEQALALATARRAAFSSLARLAPTTILEDATVPRSELTKMIRFIQETSRKHDLKIGTFGHMGDGNLHPTFLTNERNHAEMQRVEIAMKEIFEFAVSLGGTITGEHGVGIAKKEFLRSALGDPAIEVMRRMKSSFDPQGILNPGKIFNLKS